MLTQIADGVLVHESDFLQSHGVVVQGSAGVLVVDPGVRDEELACLANDLRDLGQPVVAGFSTHPDWDHVLWDAGLGSPPRYGTARCAAAIHDLLADAGWSDSVAQVLPPEIADQIPLDLFGQMTGLPAGTGRLPWDGLDIRIIEHRAHAAGHAALVVEQAGVLVAGDMLSDVLIPFLDLEAADPIGDYLAGLGQLEGVADDVEMVIPGHGSVGGAGQIRERIDLDRRYVEALRDGRGSDDPRLDPSAPNGELLPGVHEWQRQQLAERGTRGRTPG